MLLVSFLLVIVATGFLLAGLVFSRELSLIFISIGCSALAGLVLVTAVLRNRGKRRAGEAVEVAEVAEATSGGRTAVGYSPDQGAETVASGGSAFPIPGYDDLEVVEVLPRLADLDVTSLEAVRAREASGRAHPWVLARIDALLESEAETGEHDVRRAGASAPAVEWGEPEPEWAPSEWSAADFELDTPTPARDLPIARYHELKVPEVVALLGTLDAGDLKAIRAEEEANRNRAGVISRIDSLLSRGGAAERATKPASKPVSKAAQPASKAAPKETGKAPSKAAQNLALADYDSLAVAQITGRLPGLSAAELRAIRTYEKRHKNRAGVLTKIEAALRYA